jgi:hypothetical protein
VGVLVWALVSAPVAALVLRVVHLLMHVLSAPSSPRSSSVRMRCMYLLMVCVHLLITTCGYCAIVWCTVLVLCLVLRLVRSCMCSISRRHLVRCRCVCAACTY